MRTEAAIARSMTVLAVLWSGSRRSELVLGDLPAACAGDPAAPSARALAGRLLRDWGLPKAPAVVLGGCW